MEQTLIVLKPDAVQRGIIGEIISRFEKAGFKIMGIKMLEPKYEHYDKHYEVIGTLKTRKGKEIFESTLAGMQDGPVIAIVIEGVEAVDSVRKLVGDTEPRSANPGTIRGDYAHVTFAQASNIGKGVANIIHASANVKEAKLEIEHWFIDAEIHEYATVYDRFTQPK